MQVTNRINQIFGALESAGYPRAFQEALLPDWVTPEVLGDDASALEIASILAKRLGVRVGPLFSEHPSVEDLRRRNTKYKRSIRNKSKNLSAATSLAMFVAESVAYALPQPFTPFPADPLDLREEILAIDGGKWLGLRSLLKACWRHGVPVIYLDHIGEGLPKMDGLVTLIERRPVIILSKRSASWAWQLFIIAHEVAHCSLGHIDADEILIDESLGEQSYALDDPDKDERAADQFAIQLLNGRKDASYAVIGYEPNARSLAQAALEYGRSHMVDPGHVILNYSKSSNSWPLGMAAINLIEKDLKPAGTTINEILWHRIKADVLPKDTLALLSRTMA